MAVSKRLRYEIFRRDNHACRYCGAVAPDATLTIDHVVPTTLGGDDDPANLVTACRDCNSGKSATPPDAALVADVSQDAVRWALAKRRAVEMVEADRGKRQAVADEVEEVFLRTLVPSYRGGGTLFDYIPEDAFATYDQFIAAGLVLADFDEAARIAARAKANHPQYAWRYFCGVCWNKVRDLDARAAALLTADRQSEPVSPTARPHPCKYGSECPAHGDNNVPCPWCEEMDCDIWCAWVIANELSKARELERHGAAILSYASLSAVCDGAVIGNA